MKFRPSNIVSATNNFSDKYCMGVGTYGKMYNAELDHFESRSMPDIEGKNEGRLPNRRINVALKRISNDIGHGKQGFFAEIGMLTRCKHPNIVSLLGISCEDREMILVYKDAYKGSLSDYLRHAGKVTHLSWMQRIRISLDIAHGLNYLLTRTKNKQMIMHFEMSSTNILLDANWKAKITCYWHSNLYPANQEASILNTNNIGGTKMHMDPDYIQMGELKSEPGTYSFGVILFEILSGRLENDDIYVAENERLTSVARRHFEEGTLIEIIDPDMMKKAKESFIRPNQDSLAAFSKIAYQCLAETDQAKRPTMQFIIEELQNALHLQEQEEKNNLQISLADIKWATQDFSHDNLIGKGGFGQVYKGNLLCAGVHKLIAAKRLEDRTSHQGETELMTELVILSEYQHMNVIDLVSYCDENGEKVIVYDYASRGSLDRWLKHKELTWRKRLEICIDIARGLDFLHGTNDVKQEVVIHRDIKSSNILLYDDWKARIADFGLSLISPVNRDINDVIDDVKGTPGYCDPLYITTKILTKESDIYSFGVLLFEMLCGRFVMEHKLRNSSRAHDLIHLVRDHFEKGTLYEIVFEATKKQLAPNSLTAFQNIAYQCIHEEREKRPTAEDVLIQLKKALEFQEVMETWKTELPRDYERLIQIPDAPEFYYTMNKYLYTWLHKGFPHPDHKVFFSLGTNGGRVETISATEFQYKSYYRPNKWRTLSKSRFGEVVQISDSSSMNIQISVKTQLLSPGVNYGVYLVYKFCRPIDESTTRTHKLAIKMGSEDLFPEFTTRRDNDGWMRIELYRFSNLKEEANFNAFLKGFPEDPFKNVAIYVEGIEFRPIN